MLYYSNGRFIDGVVEDREGSLYEVLRVINRKPLFLDEHIERLEGCLDKKVPDVKKDIESYISEIKKDSYNIFIQYNIETNTYYIYEKSAFYPPVEWYNSIQDSQRDRWF